MILCEMRRDFPIFGVERNKGAQVLLDESVARRLERVGVVLVFDPLPPVVEHANPAPTGPASPALAVSKRFSRCCF